MLFTLIGESAMITVVKVMITIVLVRGEVMQAAFHQLLQLLFRREAQLTVPGMKFCRIQQRKYRDLQKKICLKDEYGSRMRSAWRLLKVVSYT